MSSTAETQAHPAPAGEHGAAIILAIAFLLVIGVLATALIGFAFTATTATRVYRQQRVVRYNAESSINLTIQRLKATPSIGTLSSPGCGLVSSMQEPLGDGQQQTLVSGSRLTVECSPITTGVYAPVIPSGGLDTDGGQAPRVVKIEVFCLGPAQPASSKALLECNNGGPGSRLVAKARVRLDVDYSVGDISARAIVPKIQSLNLSG